jgi:hypothetical protein
MTIKPQLGLAVAVVMLARREWRVVSGAIAAVAAQWGVAVAVFGFATFSSYLSMLRKGFQLADLLEPEPSRFHSLRAFWTLLVPQTAVASGAYLITSAMVLVLLVVLWREEIKLQVRYSALILATILISPHLGGYELVLLAPALLLTADHAEGADVRSRRVLRVLLFAAYAVPLTAVLTPATRVQLTTATCFVWLIALWWLNKGPRFGIAAHG